jgi:hypothetical protein
MEKKTFLLFPKFLWVNFIVGGRKALFLHGMSRNVIFNSLYVYFSSSIRALKALSSISKSRVMLKTKGDLLRPFVPEGV